MTFTLQAKQSLRVFEFQVGSEDLNDVMFVGQRCRWIDKENPQKAHIRVDQGKKIEELSEIVFDASIRDQVVCSKDMHTQYRSVLAQINRLQARTQYQPCYLFSRCASIRFGVCQFLLEIGVCKLKLLFLNFWKVCPFSFSFVIRLPL